MEVREDTPLNTNSGKWMLLGFMLLFLALVLVLAGILQVLLSAAHRYLTADEWPFGGLSDLCVPAIVIVALVGIFAGLSGFNSDR